MSKPSDAALAAAFWEFRKSQDETPICFLTGEDASIAKFGNAVVARARYFDMALQQSIGEQAEPADA